MTKPDSPGIFKVFVPESLLPFKELRWEADRLVATTKLGVQIEITTFVGALPSSEFKPDRYVSIPVMTPFRAEREFSILRLSGQGGPTIGYVFPLSSLVFGTELQDDSINEWILLFASAAVHAVIFQGVANHLVNMQPSLDLGVNTLDLTDLFPDEMGIITLSQTIMAKNSVTLDAVLLMVQEHGFRIFPESQPTSGLSTLKHARVLRIRPLSDHLHSSVSQLKSIISAANREVSAPARFLRYYQVIEYLIQRIFSYSLEELLGSNARTDPWDLRDKLRSLAEEKTRLNRLRHDFMKKGISHYCFEKCHEACRDFLAESGIEASEDSINSWGSALYKVRNIVIHRQVAFLPEGSPKLLQVCDCLERVVFDLITYYEEAG